MFKFNRILQLKAEPKFVGNATELCWGDTTTNRSRFMHIQFQYLLGFHVGLPMTDGLPDTLSHIAHSPAKSIEKLLKLPVERDK